MRKGLFVVKRVGYRVATPWMSRMSGGKRAFNRRLCFKSSWSTSAPRAPSETRGRFLFCYKKKSNHVDLKPGLMYKMDFTCKMLSHVTEYVRDSAVFRAFVFLGGWMTGCTTL